MQHKISLRVEDVPLYCSINSAALTFALNKKFKKTKGQKKFFRQPSVTNLIAAPDGIIIFTIRPFC